jgi:TonB family protein
MKVDKNDTTALIGTILIHLAILLFLFLAVLKTVIRDDEEGVLVNFGNINASTGIFEPRGRTEPVVENTPAPEVKPVAAKPAPKEDIITQDTEETISIAEKKKEEDRKKKEEADRKKKEALLAEQKRKEEAQRKQQQQGQAIQNRVSGAFGAGDAAGVGIGNADGGSQGEATAGTGNQGSPFGNSDSGANTGTGGMGTFDLDGRSVGAGGLPRPTYTTNVEGRIVINITVDPQGNVILAEIGKGTNIDNASVRSGAISAARRAKFNSITGSNNQSGTITYNYKYSN